MSKAVTKKKRIERSVRVVSQPLSREAMANDNKSHQLIEQAVIQPIALVLENGSKSATGITI